MIHIIIAIVNDMAKPDPVLYRALLTVRSKVYRDGYVAYDGIRYSVPRILCGQVVEIRQEGLAIEIFHNGELLARHPQALPGQRLCHLVGQWTGLAASSVTKRLREPFAQQITEPAVAVRSLSEYELLAGGDCS
ncbi:hypothetical protein [Sporomusa aerivorans]|uniref:Mu transposase domain-containing protein n=1 Tax=Sporomusa aerivorans TaxID=204936 RepID=UPI00352A0D45